MDAAVALVVAPNHEDRDRVQAAIKPHKNGELLIQQIGDANIHARHLFR
jgi:hypothetical protein